MQEDHRLVLVGVDGLEYGIIQRLRDELPNLRRIQEGGFAWSAACNFPPDSIPGWTTIYTGAPPGVHGVLGEFDYLSHNLEKTGLDTTYIKGRSFWDIASAHGKRVCIINPFLAFPPWSVNGVMISGPVVQSGEVRACPADVLTEYEIPSMGGVEYFPSRMSLARIARATELLMAKQTELAVALLQRETWDLFFVCYLTLDRIEHFFWRFWDAGDPTYPGPNRFERIIPRAYGWLDRCLGQLSRYIPDGTRILIVSDHGHTRRCTTLFNVNQMLRQIGYAHVHPDGTASKPLWETAERLKNRTLSIATKAGLEELAYKAARLVPNRGAIHKSSNLVDKDNSDVFASDIGGMTSRGGLSVNERLISRSQTTREQVISEVISRIRAYEREQIGQQLFRWIAPRESVVQGPAASRWPDILFELQPEYGVSWSLSGPTLIPSYVHRIVSGGHSPNATILTAPRPSQLLVEEPSLNDVFPTILKSIGIEPSDARYGRPLFS